MADVIELERLTKSYGDRRGVVELGFSVSRGEVFGYLGPNGAGKTTTIRTMLDLIRPTSGSARVFGLDSHANALEIHRRVWYLPGEFGMYDRMTAGEYLRFFGSLRGDVDDAAILAVAERLQLALGDPIKELSHGNKQKIGLVQAFMHRPELLILDEPTQGLDPIVQQEFHAMLAEARDEGRTIFLSSHVMPEVERLCDRVGIIREGRLVTIEDIGPPREGVPDARDPPRAARGRARVHRHRRRRPRRVRGRDRSPADDRRDGSTDQDARAVRRRRRREPRAEPRGHLPRALRRRWKAERCPLRSWAARCSARSSRRPCGTSAAR